MDIESAQRELEAMFVQSGMAPNTLDPWEGWKVFKAFLRKPLGGGYDTAGVQLVVNSDGQALHLIRQISRRSNERPMDDGPDDEIIWMLTVELRYRNARLAATPELDLWLMDFRTLEEFASVVEGEPSFQAAMAARPHATLCCTPEPYSDRPGL
jgi:hypothetical protein